MPVTSAVLPDATFGADVEFREPRTLWFLSAIPIAVAMDYALHALNVPWPWFHAWGWRSHIVGLLFAATALFVEAYLYPAWLIVGTRGVEYGHWFITRRFSWSRIHSFSVGPPPVPGVPPLVPGIAYILVKARPAAPPRPHRLPRLSVQGPEQLVQYLNECQARLSPQVPHRGLRS